MVTPHQWTFTVCIDGLLVRREVTSDDRLQSGHQFSGYLLCAYTIVGKTWQRQ